MSAPRGNRNGAASPRSAPPNRPPARGGGSPRVASPRPPASPRPSPPAPARPGPSLTGLAATASEVLPPAHHPRVETKREELGYFQRQKEKRETGEYGALLARKTLSSPLIGTSRPPLRSLPDLSLNSGKDIKSELYQWGNNCRILERPKILRGRTFKQIRCCGSHALALLEDGSVYSWGQGRCGQLGLGALLHETQQPQKVPLADPVRRLWAGLTQSAFVTETGHLFLCGLVGHETIREPRHYPSFDNVRVRDIAFGPSCVAVLGSTIRYSIVEGVDDEEGPPVVWVWGHSRHGHLGLGRTTIEEPCELESLSDKRVTQISAGEYHMAATTHDHRVFLWGTCEASGTGEEEGLVENPALVMCLDYKHVVEVSCGSNCTFVRTDDGAVYSWGSGRHGILGHGNLETFEFPGRIQALAETHVIGLSTGGLHTCAWTRDGQVFSWGRGKYFALGHSEGEDVLAPQLISAITEGKIILDVSCGSNETLALVEREMMEIVYGDQTSRLPVHTYPFVGHILRKMASHYNKRTEDLFLLDKDNLPLAKGLRIRQVRLAGNQSIRLISKPSLFDYACDTLLFHTPDADTIKKGPAAVPTVRGGTIHKLIEWLIFPLPTGHEYQQTFMLMYQTFVAPQRLLEMFIERFENPAIHLLPVEKMDLPFITVVPTEKQQCVIQMRAVNQIRLWINSHLTHYLRPRARAIAEMVLEEMERPAHAQLRARFKQETDGILRTAHQILEDKERVFVVEPPPPQADCPAPMEPTHEGEWDLFKYPAEELARQLTLIDYFLFFRKIRAGELIGQAWSKKQKEERAPHVLQMIHRFNTVSEWVAKQILTGRTQAARTAITERFIDTAHHLFQIHSFNCVMSILSAFNSSSLHRLKSVWEPKHGGISHASQEKLQRLQKALSVEKNMMSYRELFDSLAPPKIPFLGKYLQDLTFIDDGNSDYLDEEAGLINWDKRHKLGNIINVIVNLQLDGYAFHAIPECQEALLAIAGFEGNHEAQCYKVSKFIERKAGADITNDIGDIDDPVLQDIIHASPVPPSSSSSKTTRRALAGTGSAINLAKPLSPSPSGAAASGGGPSLSHSVSLLEIHSPSTPRTSSSPS